MALRDVIEGLALGAAVGTGQEGALRDFRQRQKQKAEQERLSLVTSPQFLENLEEKNRFFRDNDQNFVAEPDPQSQIGFNIRSLTSDEILARRIKDNPEMLSGLAEIDPEKAKNLALRTLDPQEAVSFPEKIRKKQEERTQREALALTQAPGQQDELETQIVTPLASGTTTVDLVQEGGPLEQINQLQAQRERVSAGLLNPRLKAFAASQIKSIDEEIKNLRKLESEKRKLEEGLTPENAAKASLVVKALADVKQLKKILVDKDGDANNALIGAMRGIRIPFVGATGALPIPEARRARSLLENAVNAQLRAESGAAVPESEVERAFFRFAPQATDTGKTALAKLTSLEELLEGTKKLIKGPKSLREGKKEAQEIPKKEGGQLMIDANGNRAMVFPDGTFEEIA